MKKDGVIALTGTPEWRPLRWPADERASAALREYLSGDSPELVGLSMDFRGADLTNGRFDDCWVIGADFTGVVGDGANFSGAHATEACFRRARLSGAFFVKSILDRAVFDEADMTEVQLVRTDAYGTSFVGATLRGARLGPRSGFDGADFSNADLTGCEIEFTFCDGAILAGSTLRGAHGIVVGPVVVATEPERQLLVGAELEGWFFAHGAQIRVERE